MPHKWFKSHLIIAWQLHSVQESLDKPISTLFFESIPVVYTKILSILSFDYYAGRVNSGYKDLHCISTLSHSSRSARELREDFKTPNKSTAFWTKSSSFPKTSVSLTKLSTTASNLQLSIKYGNNWFSPCCPSCCCCCSCSWQIKALRVNMIRPHNWAALSEEDCSILTQSSNPCLSFHNWMYSGEFCNNPISYLLAPSLYILGLTRYTIYRFGSYWGIIAIFNLHKLIHLFHSSQFNKLSLLSLLNKASEWRKIPSSLPLGCFERLFHKAKPHVFLILPPYPVPSGQISWAKASMVPSFWHYLFGPPTTSSSLFWGEGGGITNSKSSKAMILSSKLVSVDLITAAHSISPL